MVGNIQCNAEGGREWTEDMKTLSSLSFPFPLSLSLTFISSLCFKACTMASSADRASIPSS